jgi:hypothetical protein
MKIGPSSQPGRPGSIEVRRFELFSAREALSEGLAVRARRR